MLPACDICLTAWLPPLAAYDTLSSPCVCRYVHAQVIRILRDAFDAVRLPLYLVPYSVIPNRTGDDMAQGGILEVRDLSSCINVASRPLYNMTAWC